jgi:hypothetical protein
MTRVTVVQPPGATQAQRYAWVAQLPGWDANSVAAVRRLVATFNGVTVRSFPQTAQRRTKQPQWKVRTI